MFDAWPMRRFFRFLLNLVGFGIGFGTAAATVSHFVAAPPVPGVSTKVAWWKSHTPDYDVLFLGSSRMKQLEPEVFREVFKAERPVQPFNLAVDGVRPPEDAFLLDQALQGRTAPLRFVIVEGNRLAMRISDADYGTERMTYWHDTERMWTILRRTVGRSVKRPPSFHKSISETWRNLRYVPGHLQHWLVNYSRMGLGFEWFDRFTDLHSIHRLPDDLDRYLGLQRDGFIPRSSKPMSRSKAAEYAKALAAIKLRGRSRLDPEDSASQAHFARMAAVVRAHGAQLVVVAPPIASPEVFQPLSADLVFLDYSDPEKYPQLFDPAVRLDNSHLNREGSKLFSALVAEDLFSIVLASERALNVSPLEVIEAAD